VILFTYALDTCDTMDVDYIKFETKDSSFRIINTLVGPYLLKIRW